jgi:hypothetical protein
VGAALRQACSGRAAIAAPATTKSVAIYLAGAAALLAARSAAAIPIRQGAESARTDLGYADVVVGDQVIRENPASRGTEASAEVLVGPPMTDGVVGAKKLVGAPGV